MEDGHRVQDPALRCVPVKAQALNAGVEQQVCRPGHPDGDPSEGRLRGSFPEGVVVVRAVGYRAPVQVDRRRSIPVERLGMDLGAHRRRQRHRQGVPTFVQHRDRSINVPRTHQQVQIAHRSQAGILVVRGHESGPFQENEVKLLALEGP